MPSLDQFRTDIIAVTESSKSFREKLEELSLKNLPITEAVKEGSFYLLDRQRLQTWQRKIYTEIESAAELLLPAKS